MLPVTPVISVIIVGNLIHQASPGSSPHVYLLHRYTKYHHNIQHHSILPSLPEIRTHWIQIRTKIQLPSTEATWVSQHEQTKWSQPPCRYNTLARSSVRLSCLRSNIEPRIPVFLVSFCWVSLWVFILWGYRDVIWERQIEFVSVKVPPWPLTWNWSPVNVSKRLGSAHDDCCAAIDLERSTSSHVWPTTCCGKRRSTRYQHHAIPGYRESHDAPIDNITIQ